MVVKVGDEYKPTYGLSQFTEDLLNTEPIKSNKILKKAVKTGEQVSKSLGEAVVDVFPSIGDNMDQRTITTEAPEIIQAKKFLVSKIGKEAVKFLSNIKLKDVDLKPVVTTIKDAILDSDVTIDEAVKIVQSIAKLKNVNLNANDVKTIYNFIRSTTNPGNVGAKIGRKALYKFINRMLTGGQETVLSEINYLDALQRDNIRGPFDQKPNSKKEKNTVNRTSKKPSRNKLKAKGSNDISWYTHYDSLLSTVSGLQWQYPNGSITDMRGEMLVRKAHSDNLISQRNLAVPTVAGFAVRLIESDSNNTAAISRIFATLRRANSGSVNYKIKDISAYLFNIRLIIAMYSSLRRVYGSLPKSSHTDLTRPYSTIAAMGYDFNSFSVNAANLRSFLKQWAKRLETFMPYGFPIYKRTEWLFDNIYLTSTAQKDQEYILKLAPVQTYYEYSGTGAAGTFTNIAVTSNISTNYTGLDYTTVMTNFETICSNFVNENVNAIIAGDMLKAFGAGNLFKLADIPEDYSVTPVFNQEVLDQISNAMVTEDNPSYSWVMADDTGYNGDNAIVRVSIADTLHVTYKYDKNTYLNTDRNDFSPGYVLSASRFAHTCSGNKILNFGTEIIEHIAVICYNGVSSNPYRLDDFLMRGTIAFGTFDTDAITDNIKAFAYMKAFDYLPKMRFSINAFTAQSVVTIDSSGHITTTSPLERETDTSPYIYDWGNWTPISSDEMKAIQNTAIMSLYYCPLEYREVKTLQLVSD